jgi:photosystem II stability/assembly factor-like uncharacterized protein
VGAAAGPLAHRPIDSPTAWGVGGNNPQAFIAEQGVVIFRDSNGVLFRSTDGGNVFAPVGQPVSPAFVCDFAFAASPSQRVYGVECDSGRILRSDDKGATWSVATTLTNAQPDNAAVDAGDPNRVYIATAAGVLLSTDGGASFSRLVRVSGAPGAARRLFFDAVLSTREWLSTDVDDFTSSLRSEDGGATWVDIGSPYRIIGASRTRSNTLVGTRSAPGFDNGISLSTDGGATWSEKVAIVGSQGARVGPLAFGRDPGEMFVSTFAANLGNNISRGLYYSNDDGNSFSARFAPPVDVKDLAVTSSGPATLYAGGLPLSAGSPQLYRSTNGAVTWQPVATFAAPLSSFGGTYGNTLTAIAVDPANPSRLFAGFVFPDYVMRSDDAGATWVRATVGLGAGEITSLQFDGATGSILYATQLGSGVFRSTDGGTTWAAMDAGLHDEMVLGLERDPHAAGRIYAETSTGLYRADLSSGVPSADRRAIEFYHHDFNHYFVSADLDEVAGLDAGVFQGWARTGDGFRVAASDAAGNQPVCRFFSVGFGSISSHFYTPYPTECEIVKADPKWVYEKIAFGLALPDGTTHGCPANSRALYRAWNKNENGVPNHRYTTDWQTLQDMIFKGWVFEGELQTQVFACVPY